jgi:spermidine synthase
VKKICLLFFFSGIAALTYEVLWTRHLGLIFGNTVYAAATVMMTYMFGLALGSHFAGKWELKIKRPVRMFGLLEVAVALYALCVPMIFKLIQALYRFVALNVSESLAVLTAVRVVFALILLLIPTAMMGATLPVLSKGFLSRVERFGSRLGFFYGVNTLGAVSGVLLAGFFFIPKLGLTVSNLVAVCLDASVGFISIYLARTMDQSPEIAQPIEVASKTEAPFFSRDRNANGLLLAIGASGFISLAFEVIWFRALIQIFGSTTYSFSAMLGVFLIGLALGSLAISLFADRLRQPAVIFGAAAILTGIYTLMSLYWFTAMPEFLLKNLMLEESPRWGTMIGLKFLITLFFLLVPTMLFGASFTLAAKAIRSAMNSSPRAVGDTAMFNTIGAALGAFTGGFILLPYLGMQTSLTVCATLVIILGLSLCWFESAQRTQQWISAGVSLLAIAAFLTFPAQWDKQVLSAGPHFSPWNYIIDGQVNIDELLNRRRLLYYHEGVTATTSVTLDADENMLYSSNGKVEADTTKRGMVIQRMMGHLPMLFHPNPQRVMNLGLGAGVTLGAVSCYPTKLLEVVEIEPSAREVCKIWENWNHDVIDNPHIKTTINDGRNHLFVGKATYDVITSDPFEPVVAGAGNLYTVDFFKLAKSRLSEGGYMAQFLPLYEMSNADFQMIMRSFATVFPDCAIFFTGGDTILVGSNGAPDWSLSKIEKKFEIPAVRNSLAEIGFDNPEIISSMFVAQVNINDPGFTGNRVNTDNHPFIEFSTPKSKFYYTGNQNQLSLLEHFSDIPAWMLNGLSAEQKAVVQNSHEALKMTLKANILKNKHQLGNCIRLLMEAEKLSPNNPIVRNELAASLLESANSMQAMNDMEQAAIQYQMILQYDPTSFWAVYRLINICMVNNKLNEAVELLNRGILQYPQSPLLIGLRGKMRGIENDMQGAVADLNLAVSMLPKNLYLLSDYERTLQLAGKTTKAEKIEQRIRQLLKE